LEGLAHVLFLEFKGEDRFEQMDAVDKHLSQGRPDLAGKPKTAETEEEIETLWELRKQVLPLLSQPGPGLEALSVVNDVGVPPEKLAPFITDLQHLFEKHKMDTLIYGHAGNGNLHLRPLFDVSRRGLKKRIQAIADDVYELVFKYDGTISGEHGMGRVRAPYLEREWGEKILGYMKAVKAVFDPADLFNPGVMFSNRPITDFIRPDLLRERPREEGNKE
ncbi:MAG: FAD-linked oxidase C-terminal domain-containing protein, partial [bacterium]|nr:FAD-linked oxidase C-terminal domain-containing protein [bacterium]